MQRLAFCFAAALCSAVLNSCSGGGSILNFAPNGTSDHVILSVVGPVNVPVVIAGGSLPLSAVQTNGSQNGVIVSNRYEWSASLTTGQMYQSNAFGQLKPCASIMITQGGVTTPYTADFSIYLTIDPTNESNILVSPPPTIPNPFGATLTVNYPYCLRVNAQVLIPKGSGTTKGAVGSIIVAVMNPLNPLP